MVAESAKNMPVEADGKYDKEVGFWELRYDHLF